MVFPCHFLGLYLILWWENERFTQCRGVRWSVLGCYLSTVSPSERSVTTGLTDGWRQFINASSETLPQGLLAPMALWSDLFTPAEWNHNPAMKLVALSVLPREAKCRPFMVKLLIFLEFHYPKPTHWRNLLLRTVKLLRSCSSTNYHF